MAAEIEIITDPKTIKIGIEATRRRMLALLRIKPMTVSELAEAIGKDQSTVYRHMEKLVQYGYVEVSGERKVHHIPEKIYARRAATFLLSPDTGFKGDDVKVLRKMNQRQAEAMAATLSEMPPKGALDEKALGELVWLVHQHTSDSIGALKEEGVEVMMRDLPVFQVLSLLKDYRNDPAFRKKLDALLGKAGV